MSLQPFVPKIAMPSRKANTITSLDGVHAKRQRLGELLAKLGEAEDTLRHSEQSEQDILAIVKELVASPSKLKGAKAAIMSDMFLKDEFELLHESVLKLTGCPSSGSPLP